VGGALRPVLLRGRAEHRLERTRDLLAGGARKGPTQPLGGLGEVAGLLYAPTKGVEEAEPIAGPELEEWLGRAVVQEQLVRETIDDPIARLLHRTQIVSQVSHVSLGQIRNHAFGDHQKLARVPAHIVEQLPSLRAIGEIKREAFEPAIGTLLGKLLVLDVDDGGKIDLDPAQRLRQLQAVRPGVEAGAEIEDGVGPLRDRLLDKIVNDDSADHYI